MTENQRTVLSHTSDDQPHLGADLTDNANILSELKRAGYLRITHDVGPLAVCTFELTPAGHRALRASE